MMNLVPLALLPVCSLLNHLGGQSTLIPCPRFVCRMLGQGVAFGLGAWLSGVEPELAVGMAAGATAGLSFWAVWKNGPEFMSLLGADPKLLTDARDYTTLWWEPNTWITWLCDRALGTSRRTTLTTEQKRDWGTLYGTCLGALLYTGFAPAATLVGPWAALAGLPSLLQGLVYRASTEVLYAEYKMGGMIGAMMAAVLYAYLATS